MTLESTAAPTSRDIKRGLRRLFIVLWVAWGAYWLFVWPFQVAAEDHISVSAVYADAIRVPVIVLPAAVFVIAGIPLLLLGAAILVRKVSLWVLQGFRAS